MIDENKRAQDFAAKEKERRRMRVTVDPANYEYKAEQAPIDFYDKSVPHSVGIYVRVSTTDIRQTTSFELQQKYYLDYVKEWPNWTLYSLYADEGISGTSLKHRDAFNRMIADAKAGKIDLIITKNVSRFARNVVIAIGIVRDLAELRPKVGVFFESEAIFSLDEDKQMGLSFIATMAEEESHTRSRSMETSQRMRLDNGIPLTPKLLGYTHDMDGNLVINPEEAPTVKLTFFMYLYGYSTQQIANVLIALGRKSYLGNIKWTSSSIVQILRQERHCGEVLTRKTFTENYRTHRQLKNRGERPQSRYLHHHEAIVSRDDFIAVQRMLDNAKYRNKMILPEIHVIDRGIFQGFVVINPRWASFTAKDYFSASQSVSPQDEASASVEIQSTPGDFDLRGFEITRSEFLNIAHRPTVTFEAKALKFSIACVQKYKDQILIEMLINPVTRKFAIRPADETSRNAVPISVMSGGKRVPRPIPSAAFSGTVFKLFGWNMDYKYRMTGRLVEQDKDVAYIFDAENSEAFFRTLLVKGANPADTDTTPLTTSGKHIRAVPKSWTSSFGKNFYLHQQPLSILQSQNASDWAMRLQGQLYETGQKLHITPYEELKAYIDQELKGINLEEVLNG